jgi:hypothetical protein
MSRHKLRFLPRYRNPSPLVSSDERTEHRCAFMLVVRGNSEFESKNRSINAGTYDRYCGYCGHEWTGRLGHAPCFLSPAMAE